MGTFHFPICEAPTILSDCELQVPTPILFSLNRFHRLAPNLNPSPKAIVMSLDQPEPTTGTSTTSISMPDSDDKGPGEQPTEFSTLTLLLCSVCLLNTKMQTAEASIPGIEGFRVGPLDDPFFTPLEALAAILVQHGEVIATSYALETGRIVFMDPDTTSSNAARHSYVEDSNIQGSNIPDSDVPDNVIPREFMERKVKTSFLKQLPSNFVATTNSSKSTYNFQADSTVIRNNYNLRVMECGQDLWQDFKNHKYWWAYAL